MLLLSAINLQSAVYDDNGGRDQQDVTEMLDGTF
jgi:hypothetical protein